MSADTPSRVSPSATDETQPKGTKPRRYVPCGELMMPDTFEYPPSCTKEKGHIGRHTYEAKPPGWACKNCGYDESAHDPKLGYCHHGGIMEDATTYEPRSPSSATAPNVEIGRRLRGIRIHEIVFTAEDGQEHDKWDILDAVCTLAVGALNAARAVDGLEADPATRNWPAVRSPSSPAPSSEQKTSREIDKIARIAEPVLLVIALGFLVYMGWMTR